MKLVMLYDTNVISNIDYDDLALFVAETNSFLSDIVVRELLVAKHNYRTNSDFAKKWDLFFKENEGLQDNINLAVSSVPFGIDDTYRNTKNIADIKVNELFCSMYHCWLPSALCPSFITDKNRHIVGALSWNLQLGNDKKNIIDNIVNEVKLDEIKAFNQARPVHDIPGKKIFRAWQKRCTDIRNGGYKAVDGQLIVHAMCLMFLCRMDTNILTTDYDLIDLLYNFYSSIIDKYVIWEVIKSRVDVKSLTYDNIELMIPQEEFYQIRREVEMKIEESTEGTQMAVWFYQKETKLAHQFSIFIPDWLLSYMLVSKINLDCYALCSEIASVYPIRYTWEPVLGEKVIIKLKVQKKDVEGYASTIPWPKCKFRCMYDLQEINDPNSISDFSNT